MNVLVVGAGFAGLAAAFAARRAGASVTVVQRGSGSSALYAGALDGSLPTEDDPRRALFFELCQALGLRPSEAAHIATREGVVRPASGADRAVLDLSPHAGKLIGVVDVARDDWDGRLLTRAFSESAWARSSSTRFELFSLELLERSHQRRVAAFDFAASFDRPERALQLAVLLRAHAGPAAWLLGPWLGIERPVAAEVSASVGVPVGEVTSPPGGPAGARFEAAQRALLGALEAKVVAERVARVLPRETGVALQLADGSELRGDALVLAAGAFVSGAFELSGALSGAEAAGFAVGIRGLPAALLVGEPAEQLSTLFGVDLTQAGGRLLERVGLPLTSRGDVRGMRHVFAAGDMLGPEPPCVAHALLSGLAAGTAAAAGI